MGKLKRQILNILAWVALAVGIIMIIWRIFGDSPTDLAIITPFIAIILIKIWSNSDRIRDIGYQIKLSSINTKSSFDKIKIDIDNLKNENNKKK